MNTVFFSRSAQVSANQQQANSSTQPPSAVQEMAQEDTTRLRITIESGMELLTQTIAEDLNRLQSLQVVSNMMRSGFREDLEHMVQVGKKCLHIFTFKNIFCITRSHSQLLTDFGT